MSYITTRGRFHAAIDGVGFLLQGAPGSLAYSQGQSPLYGTRFASGDRSYNDLSQYWYFAQTDWSGGIKDSFSWADDAKFFSSTNIDTWSAPGSISLARQSENEVGTDTSSEDILCGVECDVAGTLTRFIGTDDDTNSRPQVYGESAGTWASISGTTLPTAQGAISQIIGRLSYAWILTSGGGTTYVVSNWNGSALSDKSANIDTQMTGGAAASCRCGVDIAGVLYLLMNDGGNNYHALVSTAVANPTAAGSWTLLFEKTANAGVPIDVAGYGGFAYYLLYFESGNYIELRAWNIAAATDALVQKFWNVSLTRSFGLGGKLLVELGGKLIITIPKTEIWELDGTSLSRIFQVDAFKRDVLSQYVDSGYLDGGCILSDNKLWWANLMYDSSRFYNTFKTREDETTEPFIPIFARGSGAMYFVGTDSGVARNLKKVSPFGSVYKGTADLNYIVFSNHDVISGVDKLAYSVTLIFNKLLSGQKIAVEYSTDQLSSGMSWTALGNASYSTDGGVVTDKTLFFGSTVTFKKIWFRVKLEGGGTNTPTLHDFVMEYLPVPTYKKIWNLNINCGTEVKALDGQPVETTGRELKGRLERAWWTKSLLDYQDLDYATTLLNGSLAAAATSVTVDDTSAFPEQGRLRVDDEEILYTGKTPTTFTGLVRGARSTRDAAHADNAVINNAYKVIVTNLETKVPVALDDKWLEYIVGVTIREA